MKNINLMFNVVLTIAVVVLFALYFTKEKTDISPAAAMASIPDGMRIAYFNSDSIRENYALFADEKVKMEGEMKQAQTRLVNEQKKFEAEVAEFQQRAEFLTLTERESREKKLSQKQQELMMLEQNLSDQLVSKEAEVNKRIFSNVEKFLDAYSKKNKFNYILSYTQGGQIWYADKKFEITKDMLKELNEEYEKNKTADK
jgi:outer membrane protein